MRVQGNEYPASITVEKYLPISGMVEVRLRENVSEITVEDSETGSPITLYEYDEYKKILPERPDLKKDIIASMSEWLTTLRTLEVDENASILRAARDENSSLLDEMAALVDDVYNSDMEMMGL